MSPRDWATIGPWTRQWLASLPHAPENPWASCKPLPQSLLSGEPKDNNSIYSFRIVVGIELIRPHKDLRKCLAYSTLSIHVSFYNLFQKSGNGGRRVKELCLQVREDRGLVQTIHPKQSFLLVGWGFLHSCYWPAKPLGLDAEHPLHTALILGDFCVCVWSFLLCFCFLGSFCVFGPKGWASVSPFLAKVEPAQGLLGERAIAVGSQVLPSSRPHFPVSVQGSSGFRCPG